MDGIGELRKDHRDLEAALKALTATGDRAIRRRKKLRQHVTEDLARHLDLEEQVIFPLAGQEARARGAVLKATEQHQVLKHLLEQLGTTEPQEETFVPKAEVLGDTLHAHVVEEHRTVFTPLRSALSAQQLRDLGERVRQGREALANPKDYLRSG